MAVITDRPTGRAALSFPIMFLDVDGVLNDHVRQSNGVCGMHSDCVRHMNLVLAEVPELRIVVSSAWRYYVLNGHMTLEGFNLLAQTHGLHVYEKPTKTYRMVGVTEADGPLPIELEPGQSWDEVTDEQRKVMDEWGPPERARQILAYIERHDVGRYVVVDNIELPIPNQVLTHTHLGLTHLHAVRIIEAVRA